MRKALFVTLAAIIMAIPPATMAITGGGRVFGETNKQGVVEVFERFQGAFRYMKVDGKMQAWTDDGASRRAHISLMLGAPAKKVLVIGPGAGAAVDAAYFHGAESVDVVVKNPAVVKAAAFINENYGRAMKRPSTRINLDPAEKWLEKATGKYDAIFLWPAVYSPEEMAPTITVAALQKAKALLSPEGKVTLWIPLGAYKTEAVKKTLSDFSTVFPEISLWLPELTPELGWAMVVGSTAPRKIDMAKAGEQLRKIFSSYRIAEETNLFSLLSFYVTGHEGLAGALKEIKPGKTEATPDPNTKTPAGREPEIRSIDNYKFLASLRSTVTSLTNSTPEEAKKLQDYFAARTKMIEGRLTRGTPEGGMEDKHYDEAIKLAPDDQNLALLYQQLGKSFMLSNLPMKAVHFLEIAKKIAPKQAATYYYLAQSYEQMTRWEKASAEYEKLKELEPNYLQPLKDSVTIP
ncbi:MAG: hypothetical protein OEV92_03370 [Nitrospinota bacterium]|nr:hypothetical protein [Nitrospinota bacterium]